MTEIRTFGGKVLFSADTDSLKETLENAVEGDAYLRDADLGGANLRDADLRGADLRGAYLRGANLRGAKGYNPHATNDLLMLLDQPDKIRAYKLVTEKGEGPFNGGVTYTIGETVEADDASTDPYTQRAAGINVATLPWCIANWQEGYRILVVEFTAEDVAAIPYTTDGKFRLHRCTVVGEKDLIEIGVLDEVAT